MTNRLRERILARRARFVGAAIASVGVAAASAQGCGGSQTPGVCLSVAPYATEDAGPVEPTGPAPTATMATDPDPGQPDAGEPLPPEVCLKVAPDPPPDHPEPPPPHPCLSMTPG